jgi:hypothetical protein
LTFRTRFRRWRDIATLKTVWWLLLVGLVVALLLGGGTAAADRLFQSPPTDTVAPSPTSPSTSTPTPTSQDTPGPPTATLEPSQTASPAAPTADTPTPEASPTDVESVVPAPDTLTPTAPPAATEPSPGSDRYTPSEGELVFDWRLLVDTLILGLSWSWLCCGVLLLVAIPVGVAVIYVVNRRRQE